MDNTLSQLVTLSNNLGSPEKDYVILGEGNTSARADMSTFWIKASGASLRKLELTGFVQVYFQKIMDLMESTQLNDLEVRQGLESARVDQETKAVPSVETFLHAILLKLHDINFVGHTHPTAVNTILCSKNAVEAFSGSLFPDQIVYCGPAPIFIPYIDPGLPLAHAVLKATISYCETWGQAPKIVLMQNHGLLALGKTADEVENITAMTVKTARVIAGTYMLGGPNFLSSENVERIHTRPDEHYRKNFWGTR